MLSIHSQYWPEHGNRPLEVPSCMTLWCRWGCLRERAGEVAVC